jgi:hypothetical protein
MKTFHNYQKARELSAHLPEGELLRMADGLQCPDCYRAIQLFDFESIDGTAFEINCGSCHRTLIACEPAR